MIDKLLQVSESDFESISREFKYKGYKALRLSYSKPDKFKAEEAIKKLKIGVEEWDKRESLAKTVIPLVCLVKNKECLNIDNIELLESELYLDSFEVSLGIRKWLERNWEGIKILAVVLGAVAGSIVTAIFFNFF